MANIDPHAPIYRVTRVTDGQRLENGVYVDTRRVEVQLPNKDYIYVDIPVADFSADKAAEEIQAIAGDIVEVLKLQSAIPASEAPNLMVGPDGTISRQFDQPGDEELATIE